MITFITRLVKHAVVNLRTFIFIFHCKIVNLSNELYEYNKLIETFRFEFALLWFMGLDKQEEEIKINSIPSVNNAVGLN